MKKFLVVVVVILIGIQFIPVEKTNPVVDKTLEIMPSGEAKELLARACLDCHSNETKWPWYSNYAPVSWFIVAHVNDGRRAMNFSEFLKMPQNLQTLRLRRSSQTLANARMPLQSYLKYHEEAHLSDSEKTTLSAWFDETLNTVNKRKVTYECRDGLHVTADIKGNGANITIDGRPDTYVEYYMTPVGIKYTGGDVIFMIKGAHDAYFSIDDIEYNNCKIIK